MNKNRKSQIIMGLFLGMVSLSFPLGAATKLGEKDCNCNKPAQIEASVKPSKQVSKDIVVSAQKIKATKAL